MTASPGEAASGRAAPGPPLGALAAPPVRRGHTERLCGLALLGIGAYTALLGPVLPDLAERTGTRLGDTGAVFTALFAAGIVVSGLAGRLTDRFGCRLPLTAGLVVNGLALALMPWVPSFAALLAVGLLLGVGDSLIVVTAHVLVGRLHEDNEAAALNRLNVYFGVGAVLGPAAGALVRVAGGRAALVFLLVAALQLAYAWLVLRRAVEPARPSPALAGDEPRRPRLLGSPSLWLLAALLLVYVGLEIGLGAWVFSYARGAAGLSGVAATLLSSGFWLALTAGRLASGLALRRLTTTGLLVVGAVLAAVGVLLLVLAGETASVLATGVLLAGLGFGPIWPVTFALAARLFRHASGGASGVLATVAAVGGLALPWGQGRVLDTAGPAALIAVSFGCCLVLLLLAGAVARVAGPADGSAPPGADGHSLGDS